MSNYTTLADLGGTPDFGFVSPGPKDDLFHADWERKAFALTLAMGATGSWNIDQSRAARETLPDRSEPMDRALGPQFGLLHHYAVEPLRVFAQALGLAIGKHMHAMDAHDYPLLAHRVLWQTRVVPGRRTSRAHMLAQIEPSWTL